jgi:uncharacterized protein (TIGR02147 family)
MVEPSVSQMIFDSFDPKAISANGDVPVAPNLGTYTDFRAYLRDVYDYRRALESTALRPYSYSHFSAAADIKSPNYLKLIIEGRRNLSEDMMNRFAKALRLQKAEIEEFRALVRYCQATDPMERNSFLRELSELRARRDLSAGLIDASSWEKVPSWIGWVLYSLSDQKDVIFEPSELHKLFRAKASVEEIRQSLEKLILAGRLKRDPETGAITKAADSQEAGQDVPVSLIRKLQAELIYLGIESLFRDSPKDREFGALTLAMTPDEFEHVKFELRQLRKRLNKDIGVKRLSSKGDQVYQLNIQLFPVTEKSDHTKKSDNKIV